VRFELFPANLGERVAARQMLDGIDLDGHTVLADKGFAGEEFETFMADLDATFLRPDRKGEPIRYGALGAIRQWTKSVFWTCKGQLTLERHGGRTHTGLAARIALRLLALAVPL
jgi:hypothetical protein